GRELQNRFTFIVQRLAAFHRVIPTKVGTSVTPWRDQTEVPALRGDDRVVVCQSHRAKTRGSPFPINRPSRLPRQPPDHVGDSPVVAAREKKSPIPFGGETL